EDRRFLTGRGRYVADFELGAAHAAFVRSDLAHARITGIDTSEALQVPGVLAVYTHADLEGPVADRLPVLVPSDALVAPRTQFAPAPRGFEWRFDMQRSGSMRLEARGVVARYDPAEDRLLIHDSTQAPTGIRFGLALLFGMDLDRLHVVAPDVGGGFGTKVIQF